MDAMATQSLGIIQASPEAQVFTYIAGAGAGAVNSLSVFNQMFGGEPLHEARIGRAAGSPTRPVLTLVVAPQPAALDELRRGRFGRLIDQQGFLPRCLFAQPESRIGHRQAVSPAIPDRVRVNYAENLRAMLVAGNVSPNRPRTLHGDSYAAWQPFWEDIESRIRPSGDLHELRAWASRVRESTGRIAGILHMARYAGEMRERACDRPVSTDTFERAVEIGRWVLEHGRGVLLARPDAADRNAPAPPGLFEIVRAVVAGGGGTWQGLGSELLEAVRRAAPGRADWPTMPNQLTRILNESAAGLEAAGVVVEDSRHTSRGRELRLRLTDGR